MEKKEIVILGGYGSYGKLITEQLAQTNAEITVVGRSRSKGEALAKTLKVDFAQCDVNDLQTLRAVITNSFLVVNASGPFSAGDYKIPKLCIEKGIHYIDIGDGREYVANITALHEEAKAKDIFICVGASTSPAISSAMLQVLEKDSDEIESVQIALNAGNKNQAGVSTFQSILSYVGNPVDVWQSGKWKKLQGWGEAEFVNFPDPVGKRRVQLCDVPDLALFPKLVNAQTVTFKAGVEITVFNYALSVLGNLKKILPKIDLPKLAHPLIRLSGLFKFLGTFHGGLSVSVTDKTGKENSLALVAPQDGPQIPASPAILLAQKILQEGIPKVGAFPCIGFLDFAAYQDHLARFGIKSVTGQHGIWKE